MQIITLITALPGAVAQGLIWGIMAIGVYITFRILDIADLTVDGTMCTGGAVCIMMMLSGHNVWISMLAATLAGMLAGAPDMFGSLMVSGIFIHIALQVILNIAVVVNLMPNTGVTLPFISYGGTSIVFLMAEMGLALSVARQIKFEE